jgi:hypothetical protein
MMCYRIDLGINSHHTVKKQTCFLHCLKDLLSHHIIRPNTTVEALCCQGALLRLQFALITSGGSFEQFVSYL